LRRALALVLLAALAALGGEKTTAHAFTRGGGRVWRSAPPSAPSCKATLEGKPGAILFDAAKGAESYLVYLYEKPPVVEKGKEEKFWTGEQDGFVGGLEVIPREGAKSFTVLDPNKSIGWTCAYVFSVEAKSRTLIAATWKEGVKDAGEDGASFGDKYRASK